MSMKMEKRKKHFNGYNGLYKKRNFDCGGTPDGKDRGIHCFPDNAWKISPLIF